MNNTRYLNNDGSRWVDLTPGAMDFVLVLPDGTKKVRKAKCFESFGNFAAIVYTYRGKQFSGLPKSPSGFETRLDHEDPRPHVFHTLSKSFCDAVLESSKV